MSDETPPPSGRAPETADERELYRRFLDKQRETAAQKANEQREQSSRVTHDVEAALARRLGALADNGNGMCRWCSIVLGTDAEGRKTHPPLRECPGPQPAACELCGRAWWFDKARSEWTHQCAGGKRASTKSTDVARVQTPGDGRGGFFGMRRGE